MKLKDVGTLLVETVNAFGQDAAPRLAAALAYYTVVTLAPLLVVLVGIVGQVLGPEAARGEIVGEIQGAIGREAAVLVEQAIRAASSGDGGLTATVLGLVGLFLGATTVFANLQGALNTVWHVRPEAGEGGPLKTIKNWVFNRFGVFLVVLGIGLLFLASVVASTAVEAAATYAVERLPTPPGTLRLLNTVVSLVVVTVLFAYVYRTVPDARIAWSDVAVGALITGLLFTLGKYVIGLYLARSTVGSAYGAAGALMVLLVWLYYSAFVFFLGAEFTHVYTTRFGSGLKAERGFVVGERERRAESRAEPRAEPHTEPRAGSAGTD